MAKSFKDYALGIGLLALVFFGGMPDLALAQATSPFMTGASALQTNILAWLTPIAIILAMILGSIAMANRIRRFSALVPYRCDARNSNIFLLVNLLARCETEAGRAIQVVCCSER